jgi:hypothetical protein
VEVDGEGIAEALDLEFLVFAGEVAGVIGGGIVGDGLEVDVDGLVESLRSVICDATGAM